MYFCGVQINAHTSVPPSTLALICQLLKHSASDPYVFFVVYKLTLTRVCLRVLWP